MMPSKLWSFSKLLWLSVPSFALLTFSEASLLAAGARLFKSGPIQITADGRSVWVANTDNDSVTRINTTNDAVNEYVLPDPGTKDSPRGLSVKEDGSEVWVACHDSDRVYVLANDASLISTIDLPWGSGPYSIALSRDQRTALVTLYRSASLAVIDVSTRQLTHILKPVYWSPMGIAWCEDGVSAWVTHLFAEGEHPFITRVDFSGPEPKVKTRITVFPSDPRHSSTLTAPYNVAEGGYLTTRGHPAQVPSVSGRNQLWLPTQYNNISEDIYTPNSTVQTTIRHLDLATRKIPNGVNDKVILSALHVHDTAGSNPYVGPGWNAQVAGPIDIGFSSDGGMTYLLNELSSDLVVLSSSTPSSRPTNAAPLTEISVGNRPMGLAVSPSQDIAYVCNLLSRDVSVVGLVARTELRRIPVTPVSGEPFPASVLIGAKIFHTSDDPRISGNRKVSCASCHINAEHDGRSWAFHRLPGPHGPREVPSLLGLNRTMGPRDPATGLGQLHRSGDRDEIQDFEHTFQGVSMAATGFLATNVQAELGPPNAGRSAELDGLADYLLFLEPIRRSPYRAADGSLTEAATRGATFFVGTNRTGRAADAGCAVCHVPETGFVDFKFHDVGQTRPASEEELNTRPPLWHVNTPTLIGVWTTPPYNGVAGYAPSIMGVLKDQAKRAGTSTSHGKPDGLIGRQLADLAEFVLSIDGNMTAAEVRNARDTAPPRVVRVEPASLTRLDVWFSETVKRSTATNPANWRLEKVGGGVTPITAAVWDGQNGDRITLATSLQPNSDYRLVPVGVIQDEAGAASGGVANTLDTADAANTKLFSIGTTLTITLGASGYENLTVPVHDAAMTGPNLSTWSHDSIWLFPVSGTPKVNTGFVRFDWRNAFAQATGTGLASDILDASFSLHCEMGDANAVEIRRVLQSWSDPATGGDWNQNAVGGPTWRDHAHPSAPWNLGGAGRLGRLGDNPSDYNGTNDLAARIDAVVQLQAVNEEVAFEGPLVTEAFRFWFNNPALDCGYALRLTNSATQELKFERTEDGLRENGPVLTITYALPTPPQLTSPAVPTNGAIEFTLNGHAGRSYTIQVSPDLVAWSVLTNLVSTNSSTQIQDMAPAAGRRFYRAVTP
jgi:DNA-binding beta-propeller fold protein YncE